MQILHPEVSRYMESLLPARDTHFSDMESHAQEHNFPIVGALSGSCLAQLARMCGARRVLELGSGFGYSALWLLSVLPEDGSIVCSDRSEENRERAMRMFDELGYTDRVDFRCGDALEILDSTEGEFDFIFCDIDKLDYPEVYRRAFPRIRKRGALVFDNALWSGRMLEGDDSEKTRCVVELNRMAHADPACLASIIPVRDGLLVCCKR